jgi:SAM-dependent methyltransferase
MSNYRNHKPPRNTNPSDFVVKFFDEYDVSKSMPILDLACGYGRNALYAESLGYKVIASDLDDSILTNTEVLNNQNFHFKRFDANEDLPIGLKSLSAILVVHYYSENLFERIKKLVCEGGYILYESISAHGENWKELDKKGRVEDQLKNEFKFEYINKREISKNIEYETIKFIVRKK